MNRLLQVAVATFCLLSGGLGTAGEGPLYLASAPSARAAGNDAAGLAELRGCTFCHREPSPAADANGSLPIAPSFHDIASRYRARPGAETELGRVIVEGADPQDLHWKQRLEFAAMRGNAPQVSPEEARALARWILGAR